MNFVSQNILLYCTHLYDDVSCDSVEAQTRRATPRPRPGAATGRSYLMPEVMGGGGEEQPHVQGVVAEWVQKG